MTSVEISQCLTRPHDPDEDIGALDDLGADLVAWLFSQQQAVPGRSDSGTRNGQRTLRRAVGLRRSSGGRPGACDWYVVDRC